LRSPLPVFVPDASTQVKEEAGERHVSNETLDVFDGGGQRMFIDVSMNDGSSKGEL
jgi:hypothetical protein